MRHFVAMFLVGLAVTRTAGGIEDDILTPQNVAQSFGYSGVLEGRDVTELNQRMNSQVMWSRDFTAPDNTFAPTTVTIASGHSILTPSLSQQLESNADRELKLPSGAIAPPVIRRLTLQDGGKGFLFLSGLGPGGTDYAAVVTSSDGATDVAISVRLPSATPLRRTEQTQAYYDAVNKGQDGVLALLGTCMPALYSVAASNIKSTLIADASRSATVGTSPNVASPMLMPTAAVRMVAPSPSFSPSASRPALPSSWILMTIITVAILAVGMVFFRRRP